MVIRQELEFLALQEERARRLQARLDAGDHQGGALYPLAPPGLLQGGHVRADRYRGRELLPQADELPASPHDLSGDAAFLSRAAAAAGRVWPLLSLRGVGRAVRPDARARLHAERRAYLLPLRSGEGRVPEGDAPACPLLRHDGHQGLLHALLAARPDEEAQFRRRAGEVARRRRDHPRRDEGDRISLCRIGRAKPRSTVPRSTS